MKEFEVRTIVYDKYDNPRIMVVMDLETYNEALADFIEHTRDQCFNDGFRAGNCYPSEEELANMDDDDTKEE